MKQQTQIEEINPDEQATIAGGKQAHIPIPVEPIIVPPPRYFTQALGEDGGELPNPAI